MYDLNLKKRHHEAEELMNVMNESHGTKIMFFEQVIKFNISADMKL